MRAALNYTVPSDEAALLGLRIDNVTMRQALDWIMRKLDGTAFHQISFLNADCVNQAYLDSDYREILRRSSRVLADGVGLRWGCRLLGQEIRENVNGTDIFPLLCERLRGTGKRLFLLGAAPGVAQDVREWIETNYPGVIVCGVRHGFFTADEEPEVLQIIAESQADLLLVAMGVPRQEKWIARAAAASGVKLAMGVGGLFDFYSGRIPRAPLWLRELSLEWTYRLYQEPRRMWRRYLIGNFVFLWRVFKERMNRLPEIAEAQ